MKSQRRFETASATALRETTVIRSMLRDLERTIKLLDDDIAAEEERAQIFDIFNARYPILARALVARRDNMKATVAALAQRLGAMSVAIADAVHEAA